MGLSIAELDQMEEGAVMDMIIESGNDACAEEYCTVADLKAMDAFWATLYPLFFADRLKVVLSQITHAAKKCLLRF